jgi:pyruvate/2-oxoglutarate dehydrogenase complex dihydrolipoamide dehydrogenase (E3) component
MVADRDRDVIVIGTGAGGGMLAHRLAAPSSRASAVNPSLTAIANVLRIGDVITERFRG